MSTSTLPKTPGVYLIVNTINQHTYVGSTSNLLRRYAEHLRKLRNGKHDNSHLQRAYDLYGSDVFAFCAIDHLPDTSKLVEREQLFIDFIKPEYNIAPFANSPVLETHSPEHVSKQAAAQKATREAKKLENPDAYKFSPESIARRTASIKATREAKLLENPDAYKLSPEHLASLNAGSNSPESIAKMRVSLTGKKQSPETKAKRVATTKSRREAGLYAPVTRKMSPETIAKRTATLKATNEAKRLEDPDAFKQDPARMAKMTEAARVANTGRSKLVPPEHLANMTEAARLANTGKKLSPSSVAKREATKRAKREAKLKPEQ